MAKTRLPTDQITIYSSATGTHNLDTYIEASEKGGRTLPDMLDDLFNETGTLIADIELRYNSGDIQYRHGMFVNPEEGWVSIATFHKWQGVYTAGNNYNAGDVVEYQNGVIYFVDAYANVPATPNPTTDPKLIWLIDDAYVSDKLNTMALLKSDTQTLADQTVTNAANAATSASNALTSEANASISEDNANDSAIQAALSETNAATSEANALASEQAAASSESNAATSEANTLAIYNELNNPVLLGLQRTFIPEMSFYPSANNFPLMMSLGKTFYSIYSSPEFRLRREDLETNIPEDFQITVDYLTHTVIAGAAYDYSNNRMFLVTNAAEKFTVHEVNPSILQISSNVNLSDYITSSSSEVTLEIGYYPMVSCVAYDSNLDEVIVLITNSSSVQSYYKVPASTLLIGTPIAQVSWGGIALTFPSAFCITPDNDYWVSQDTSIKKINPSDFSLTILNFSAVPAGSFGSNYTALVHNLFNRIFVRTGVGKQDLYIDYIKLQVS